MELAGTVFMVSHMVNYFAADFLLQDSATSKLTKMTPEQHYIWFVKEVPISTLAAPEEDKTNSDTGDLLHIIICMTQESSHQIDCAHFAEQYCL